MVPPGSCAVGWSTDFGSTSVQFHSEATNQISLARYQGQQNVPILIPSGSYTIPAVCAPNSVSN